MLTIFSVPKPFQKEINIIQRNAILSWLKLQPECEIILFGDDKGVSEIASELGIKHIPEISRNEFGTPLVNDIFEKAQKIAKNKTLVYVNCDIVLMADFILAIQKINFPKFLMIGRRLDLDIRELINFNEISWEKKLREKAVKEGKPHGPAGIDYFVHSKGIYENIPSFALGRTVWDNWLLYKAWISKIPIIDATEIVMTIHQNHSYSHPKGKVGIWKGKEAENNLKLAGGVGRMLTIRDATLTLTYTSIQKPKLTIYRIFSFPFRYFEKLPFLKPFLFPGWLAMIFWRKIKSRFV